MEHQYLNKEISYTRDYASHLAGKKYADATVDTSSTSSSSSSTSQITQLVGDALKNVTGFLSILKGKPAAQASVATQNSLLQQRNTLLQNSCTYGDISNYNSQIWNSFQDLDQAALHAGGHNVYEYFIYFTPDKSKFDKNDTYGVISGRSVPPSQNGKTLTAICPPSEMYFFNSTADRNALNFTCASDISTAMKTTGSLSIGQSVSAGVTSKGSTALAGLSTPLIIIMILVIGGFFFINKK
jgi:hypothetical protein